ncbi:MAG: Rnase Y domain-containing protein, partial [Bacteroidota bacterium]
MEFIPGIIGLVVGVIVTYFIGASQRKKLLANQGQQDQTHKLEAERIITEAKLKAEQTFSEYKVKEEAFKKEKIKESREKFQRFKEEFKQEKAEELVELKEKRQALREEQATMKEERSGFKAERDEINKEKKALQQEEQNLTHRAKQLEEEISRTKKKQEELATQHERFTDELEKIAGLSQADAKARLLEEIKAKTANEALTLKRELLEEAKAEATKDARKVVINTIQRMCAEMTIENTVSVFPLDNDNVKGQIIGREGRNIRAIESATGAELVVDDTPETIVISSFDPIRREIARLSLKRLVTDGRIHPARVEEVVNKTKKELKNQIMEIGKKT